MTLRNNPAFLDFRVFLLLHKKLSQSQWLKSTFIYSLNFRGLGVRMALFSVVTRLLSMLAGAMILIWSLGIPSRSPVVGKFIFLRLHVWDPHLLSPDVTQKLLSVLRGNPQFFATWPPQIVHKRDVCLLPSQEENVSLDLHYFT